jgi:transketolase
MKKTAPRFKLRPRRGVEIAWKPVEPKDYELLKAIDLTYRTLCACLFNFVPGSGHPGGSVSSGRTVISLLYETMAYDLGEPSREDADRIVYAAGHKAMGLYAMWALRDELARIAAPGLLPSDERKRLRLEDLLGFRRNPTQPTPLFKQLRSKSLDGHPTPATPFVPLATGASGIGDCSGLGLALGAMDAFGPKAAPRVHLIEGEGGLTAGRVHEAVAAAATLGLENAVLHIDWNQASIDSDQVTGEGDRPGDYVPWDPVELMRLHDWNVAFVPEGHKFSGVLGAQAAAMKVKNGQPTAIVYRTTKGWRYGITGKKSHGAGHAFCSPEFYAALKPFEDRFGVQLPRHDGDKKADKVEAVFYETLMSIRRALEADGKVAAAAARRLEKSKERLAKAARAPRPNGPDLEKAYALCDPNATPEPLQLKPGASATLRGALGAALGHLNRASNGAFLGVAADLFESTSLAEMNKGFPAGFFHSKKNPLTRLVTVGGICEDAMGGFMSGVSSFGRHIGASSSYAAFIAALEHVPARLHAIGQQMREHCEDGVRYRPWILIAAHAGPKTGEDGPTHADPQSLQLVLDNFPRRMSLTLTPWDPAELWPMIAAGLRARPAMLIPFVTRPAELIVDRAAAGLPPASAAAQGVYALRRAEGAPTVVIQGSGAANVFVREVLPKLDAEGVRLNAFYIASAELFDLLPDAEKERIFPEALRARAMALTDFTLATMYRWVTSEAGRRASLYPFKETRYLGSGSGDRVLFEGGLGADNQLKAIRAWCAGAPAAV